MRVRRKCEFYEKTGGCRYFESCQKVHQEVFESNTVLLEGVVPCLRAPPSPEAEKNFLLNVYEDLFVFCSKYGHVQRAEIARNLNHLFGNFYVQFGDKNDAKSCLNALHGLKYAGKTISARFVKPYLLQNALCNKNTACDPATCNFIHVADVSFIKARIKSHLNLHKGSV